jgi:hypothetical protein
MQPTRSTSVTQVQIKEQSIMRFVVSLTFVLAISSVGRGAIQVESEDGGTSNNTLGTAEAIPSTRFTPPVLTTIFDPPGWATATIQGSGGESDVDFYSFTTGGGGALFDIDNDPFTFDTLLSLFDSTGTLIGIGDDSSPEDPGTAVSLDSFLGEITLDPGTYYVAVSLFANLPLGATASGVTFTPLIRPDGGDGGLAVMGAPPGNSSFPASGPDGPAPYTLHISLENVAGGSVIPEPTSLVVWSLLGMITVGAATQRTRNSQQADS